MKQKVLKTLLASVLTVCILIPCSTLASAKTKYTVEVTKTGIEADTVFNTQGYASLTKNYRLTEEEKAQIYDSLINYWLEEGETVEEYLKRKGFENLEEYYLDYANTSGEFAQYNALMDNSGKMIMPYTYSINNYYVSDGIIAKGNWYNTYSYPDAETNGFFDLEGNKINKTEYLYSRNFSDGIAFVRRNSAAVDDDNFWDGFTRGLDACLIDKDENIVLDLPDSFAFSYGVGDGPLWFVGNYNFVGEYSEGLIGFASVFRYKDTVFMNDSDLYSTGSNFRLTGYMDIEGNIAIPQTYYNGGSFHNGLAWVQEAVSENAENIYDMTYAAGGKFGYINKKGELVIPYIYDNVTDFDGEYAAAEKDGKWGIINTKGETVIPFTYDAMAIYDGIITYEDNDNSHYALMTIDKKIIWQIDEKDADVISAYNDGVLYYTKDGYVNIVTVTIEEAEDRIKGDADGNGTITAADARYSLRASVGLEPISEELASLLDINKDNKITAADARLILRASVGLEDTAKW